MLEEVVVNLLKEKNMRIATAESCTGGMLAARIIDVAGASEVFKVGHITYANEAKQEVLGVSEESLLRYGAVSEQVAREMVEGLASNSQAEVSISITGIAGPGGGTIEKPVGLVHMGCVVKGEVVVRKFLFQGDRKTVRESAVVAALELIRERVG